MNSSKLKWKENGIWEKLKQNFEKQNKTEFIGP